MGVSHSKKLLYRPEIDGLRAIAIIPVIFFHAGYDFFSGGFVGVDIFFVLSGFLITSILYQEVSTSQFTYLSFYERRARRILPALFLVIGVTSIFSWHMLLPSEMIDYSKSVIGTFLFVSNAVFWRQTGYFDAAAELKPLIHMWSLSIEEQFYFLLPILIILCWKFWGRHIFLLVLVLTLCSFFSSAYCILYWPSAAYFLLPFRAWELGLGSLAGIYLFKNEKSVNFKASFAQYLSALGLGMIIFSILCYSKSTPFPGMYALVPTLGTVLIILYASPRTCVGWLLGKKLFVGIGLISYSAYLWHQPILSFARLGNVISVHNISPLLLTLFSLSLAFLTYKYVERPFRSKEFINSQKFLILSLIGGMSFLIFGAFGIYTNGYANRYVEFTNPLSRLAVIENLYDFYDYKKTLRSDLCHSVTYDQWLKNNCLDLRGRNVFLWGDSYSASLYSGLDHIRNENFSNFGITQITDGNAPPFFMNGSVEGGRNLISVNENKLELLRLYKPDIVILSWMITATNAPRGKKETFDEMLVTLERIRNVSPDTRVIVIGPFPKWHISLRNKMIEYYRLNGVIPPLFMGYGLSSVERVWDNYLKTSLSFNNVTYISAYDALCNSEGCLTRASDNLTEITAIDWGHLTKYGSIYLIEKIQSSIFR
jgi:peptidoglycan/LPS O-acetylase OafA/YrhL